MNENNPYLPREFRVGVQSHLDSLNTILDAPDLTQVDVACGDEYGRVIFRLKDGAEERVTEKFAWLVAHQLPVVKPSKPVVNLAPNNKAPFAPVKAKKPEPPVVDTVPGPRAIPVKCREAAAFFAIPFPAEPTMPGEVESQVINRK